MWYLVSDEKLIPQAKVYQLYWEKVVAGFWIVSVWNNIITFHNCYLPTSMLNNNNFKRAQQGH